LSFEGGALKKMLMPYLLGLGGVMGSGKQWMSWIVLEDLLRAIIFSLENVNVQGHVNAVSPEPITNYTFTKAMGAALYRPTLCWMPAWVVKFVFGEMGVELFLKSQRAHPKKLLDAGFSFIHPNIHDALQSILQH
jgi:uncharacterized protein (TIGR01777 family)